jgi:hypothetical protein
MNSFDRPVTLGVIVGNRGFFRTRQRTQDGAVLMQASRRSAWA